MKPEPQYVVWWHDGTGWWPTAAQPQSRAQETYNTARSNGKTVRMHPRLTVTKQYRIEG